MAAATKILRFTLNGRRIEIENPDPQQLLVHWLRETGHTGTKFVCGQGGCGACTVNIRPWSTPEANFLAANACLRPLAAVHEMDVLTVEGLGSLNSTPKYMSEIQEKIAIYNGSQCGYCTPGFVMGMNAYLDQTQQDERTLVDIENLFDGHLCRCTGYRPILCGMKTFAKDGNEAELSQTPTLVLDTTKGYSTGESRHPNVAVVKSNEEFVDAPTLPTFEKGDSIWYHLQTLDQLWKVLKKYEKKRERVRIITGNTAYGIQPFQKFIAKQDIMLFVGHIPELTGLKYDDEKIVAHCAVPLQKLWNLMKHLYRADKSNSDQQSSYPPAIAYKHWRRLATTEIRNVASIAGNLYLARELGFSSDLFIVLAALGATVTIASHTDNGVMTQECSMMEFLKRADLLDGTNIIYGIEIPIKQKENVFIDTFKVSSRPQNSHPLINAGFSVKVSGNKFEDVKIFYGNIGNKGPQEMTDTEEWVESNCTPANMHEKLAEMFSTLRRELMKTDPTTKRRVSDLSFCIDTACSIFFKYLLSMACTFQLPGWSTAGEMHSAPESLVNWRFTETSVGEQDFCVYQDTYPVSEPVVKESAFLQATGEAKYTQDIGRQSHHLHGVYILNLGKNAQPYADFEISIPPDFKKNFPGVVHVFTAHDFCNPDDPENQHKMVYPRNDMGRGQEGFPGDTIFAQNEVSYVGQPIGMVVANTQETARKAAEWLQDNAVAYKSKDKAAIVTLDDAIKKESYFYDKSGHKDAPPRLLKISRPESLTKIDWNAYDKDPTRVVVEGTQGAADQYHFYMETQAAIAFPTEQGGIKVYASTQSPNEVQSKVAKTCNLPMNQVTVEISRLGGGYGGKEVQSKFVPAAAAFCAQQLNQPVRVANYRVEDMQMIGKRHAYMGTFKIAASTDGIIEAMQIHFCSDGGCTYDATFPVMDLALLSSDNAYYVPEFLVEGDCARTNKASSTAFRSFGVIQTMLIVEAGIEALAEKLEISDDLLREKNFYQQNQRTPYGQQLHYCNLRGVWDTVKESSNYAERKKIVEKFNVNNVYKKRGIKLIPLKYGISFTRKASNQGAALINVYSADGTVLLSHGGVEMGQGLNTKMMQIAAQELNIPMNLIRIPANSTEKIANAVSTGASTGGDLNGGAVKDACIKLRKRLENFMQSCIKERATKPTKSEQGKSDQDKLLDYWEQNGIWYKLGDKNFWRNVVRMAYDNRISLISHGFYKSPDLTEVTNDNPTGRPFYYFNYAAAVSEVEVDVLTGEFTILRSDIVYDAGHSLNPAIDVGQIEGGFIMGVGNVTTEELLFDDNGRLLTDGTWEYKPPCSKSIPKDFRVTLYPGVKHKELSKPHDRVCHVSSKEDNHVKIDPHGIQSSKTTGEPPLVLANTVFFAIKQAVAAARKEVGLTGQFTFDAPATVQKIQQACGFTPDKIAEHTKSTLKIKE